MASLNGKTLADTSGLVGSSQPNAAFEKLNLCDRVALFAPGRFSFPAIDKPNRKLQSTVVNSALVKLHLVSSDNVGNITRGGKIGSGKNCKLVSLQLLLVSPPMAFVLVVLKLMALTRPIFISRHRLFEVRLQYI